MATGILVNIGSGNGLLPEGIKAIGLLPEPMLTYHQGQQENFIAGLCNYR